MVRRMITIRRRTLLPSRTHRCAARRSAAFAFAIVLVTSLACVGGQGDATAQASAGDTEARIREKMETFQVRAEAYIRDGGDASTVQSQAKRIQERLRAGDPTGAEKLIDEGIELVGSKPAPAAAADAAEAPDARVQRKLEAFQAGASRWVESGGDPSKVKAYGERIDRALKSGDIDAGERVVDEALATFGAEAAPPAPASTTSRSAGPRRVDLKPIPANAEIVFHKDGQIYVMDGRGENVQRVTSIEKRRLEHVAVSHDRKRIAANYWARPKQGGASSRLLVYDLEAGTETELVPDFVMAGNGGVDWDRDGNVYFAGVQTEPAPNPRSRADLLANAGANDVWRVKWDGTGLTRITDTRDLGEADVSVSDDGRFVTYMATRLDPSREGTEIWMSRSDGSERRRVYEGGKMGVTSVHDPEFSPDNREILFSRVNPDFKNFRSDEAGNTAHDICAVKTDGSGFRRITEPGPIAIIPDRKGDRVLYLELTDRGGEIYTGLSVIGADGTGKQRIQRGADTGKWIPSD
jgi:hypothetical protein